MEEELYIPRYIDEKMAFYLDTFGAVYLKGPKWCGKTTTALHFSKSHVKLQDEENSASYLLAAEANPFLLLKGESPRLIDEWQMVPGIWNAVRSDVDRKKQNGLYILTGSKVPKGDEYRHSGAGRFGVLSMRPMSLSESGDSNRNVSISKLFEGKQSIDGQESKLSVEELAYCLCRGGWPANLGMDYKKCRARIRSYLEIIYESDDLELKKYAKNPDVAASIVRSYSRNISQLSDNQTIYKDAVRDGQYVSIDQFYDYQNALKNVFILDEVKAWNPNIRSKSAIRSTPKKELFDPSIGAYYLNITPENFVNDFETFGFLFESMAIRDLKVYAESLGGKLYYYHDRNGLEADAVIVLEDDRYALVEVKLGSKEIIKARDNLSELEYLISGNGYRSPSFKMILTGGKNAMSLPCSYKGKQFDDAFVVPIGCLTL